MKPIVEIVTNVMCFFGIHDWVCASYHTAKNYVRGEGTKYVRKFRCSNCNKVKTVEI